MRILFASISLFLCYGLFFGCSSNVSGQMKGKTTDPDTTYCGEYRYLESLYGESGQYSPKTKFWRAPTMSSGLQLSSCGPLIKLDTATRLKILRLMRLPSLQVDEYGSTAYFFLDEKGRMDLYMHPRGVYAPIPTEYLLAFDNIASLLTPLCLDAVRDVLGKMKNLEKAKLTIMSMKPYTINLSGLDMRHIKSLTLIGLTCENIIFPKENTLQELSIINTNIVELDSSFNQLTHLKHLFITDTPLKRLDLKNLNELDTLIIERDIKSSNIKKLLVNQKPDLFVDERRFVDEPLPLFYGHIIRKNEMKYSLYQKQVAAMKCDCE